MKKELRAENGTTKLTVVATFLASKPSIISRGISILPPPTPKIPAIKPTVVPTDNSI